MKRKVKLPNGQEKIATVVPFEPMNENWNELNLNDGTTLKVKTTVIEVLRVEGEFNQQGDPIYLINSTNLLTCSNVPDHLRNPNSLVGN